MSENTETESTTESTTTTEAATQDANAAPAKTEDNESKIIQKEIEVTLTVADFANKAKEVAKLSGERDVLETEFKKIKGEKQAEIDDKQEQIDKIVAVITRGKELQVIDVTMIKDFEANEVRFMRGEEVVESRAMTGSERQIGLPLKENSVKFPQPAENADLAELDKSVGEQVRDVIQQETGKASKRSAVDGAVA